MAIAMLLALPGADEPALGPDAAERLSQLGVTRLSVLRDASGIGVVLEGWAFDPASIDDAVRAMFPVGGASVRVLRELERVVVSAAPAEGRSREWTSRIDPSAEGSSR